MSKRENIEEIRREFKAYKKTIQLCTSAQLNAERAEHEQTGLHSVMFGGVGSGGGSPHERDLSSAIKRTELLTDIKDAYMKKVEFLNMLIDSIPLEKRIYVTHKYVLGRADEELYGLTGYSSETFVKKRKQAIEDVATDENIRKLTQLDADIEESQSRYYQYRRNNNDL